MDLKIEQGKNKVTLRRGAVSITLAPDVLFEIAGQHALKRQERLDLIAQDTPLSSFHELLRDKWRARYYTLEIKFTESGDTLDGGDYPERIDMELSLVKFGQRLELDIDDEDWSHVDFTEQLNRLAQEAMSRMATSEAG